MIPDGVRGGVSHIRIHVQNLVLVQLQDGLTGVAEHQGASGDDDVLSAAGGKNVPIVPLVHIRDQRGDLGPASISSIGIHPGGIFPGLCGPFQPVPSTGAVCSSLGVKQLLQGILKTLFLQLFGLLIRLLQNLDRQIIFFISTDILRLLFQQFQIGDNGPLYQSRRGCPAIQQLYFFQVLVLSPQFFEYLIRQLILDRLLALLASLMGKGSY